MGGGAGKNVNFVTVKVEGFAGLHFQHEKGNIGSFLNYCSHPSSFKCISGVIRAQNP